MTKKKTTKKKPKYLGRISKKPSKLRESAITVYIKGRRYEFTKKEVKRARRRVTG